MKSKGFTLVELITTFALASVIIILLINIVVVIKNIYSKTNIKTELYINQSNLSNVLNTKFTKDNLDSYRNCEESDEYIICQIFKFKDSEDEIKLEVTSNKIKFGNYVYKLPEYAIVKNNTNDELFKTDIVNNILNLQIPIYCDIYPNINFGINIVYLNSSN